MTKEEIIQAISDDKMMPFIQPDQLAQIVAFIINNYQPSLPSNLDEAAEKSMPEEEGFLEIDIYGGSEAVYSREQMFAMFKAGAELVAGQGVKIGETKIYLEDDGDEPPYSQEWLDFESTEFKLPNGAFQPGDEVEVILRKKQ